MPERFVKISESYFCQLLAAQDELLRLEAGGVDNWEGYSEAFDDLNEDVLEAEIKEKVERFLIKD